MCRVLGYIGPTVPLADLITKPANSLINQSFDAEYHDMLQLAGSGLASWEKGSHDERRPLVYRSHLPAFYDKNLRALCAKLDTTCLLAHVRATGYSTNSSVNDDNCHPFVYPGYRLALAHNGGLPGWRDMLSDILAACRPEVVAHLTGSTDTEPMYCLLMSQFEDPTANLSAEEIVAGLRSFMEEIVAIKKKHGNSQLAKLKFFMADGNDLVVANLGLGPDYRHDVDSSWEELRGAERGTAEFALAGVVEPLWYHAGSDYREGPDGFRMQCRSGEDMDSVIISSEHLTEYPDDWTEVPFQHVVFFRRGEKGCSIRVERLDFDG